MVLMLLSTLPPPSFSPSTAASASPLSPCSNPFSTSFAAVLRPVFSCDNLEDIDMSFTGTSTTTITETDMKPSFTYPWLKPSPLNLKASKKALPPLPSAAKGAVSPTQSSHIRQRSLAASFGASSATTRAARRSRYDSVPSVYVERDQSRSPDRSTTTSQQMSPPNQKFSTSISAPDQSPNMNQNSTHAHFVSQSPTKPAKISNATRRINEDHQNKLDMSIALAGIELDMSGSSFTPSASFSASSEDSFGSSISSIFDAPEPLSFNGRSGQSSVSSYSSEREGDEDSMLVPLAIEIGEPERKVLGAGRRENVLRPVPGAENRPRWPRRGSSAGHGRKISAQREIGVLPMVIEA